MKLLSAKNLFKTTTPSSFDKSGKTILVILYYFVKKISEPKPWWAFSISLLTCQGLLWNGKDVRDQREFWKFHDNILSMCERTGGRIARIRASGSLPDRIWRWTPSREEMATSECQSQVMER